MLHQHCLHYYTEYTSAKCRRTRSVNRVIVFVVVVDTSLRNYYFLFVFISCE